LFFCWDAFDIEGMIEEKINGTSFGRAAGHGKQAPGAGDAHARTPDASAAQPLHETDRAAPVRRVWHLGHGKRPDWLWQPERHLALGSLQCEG
jgi:hypothetical protein